MLRYKHYTMLRIVSLGLFTNGQFTLKKQIIKETKYQKCKQKNNNSS